MISLLSTLRSSILFCHIPIKYWSTRDCELYFASHVLATDAMPVLILNPIWVRGCVTRSDDTRGSKVEDIRGLHHSICCTRITPSGLLTQVSMDKDISLTIRIVVLD